MAPTTPPGLRKALALITSAPPETLAALGSSRAAQLQRLRALLQQRNIVGVGISEKTAEDQTTGELSVCFYVRKKRSPRQVRGDAMIPPLIAGAGSIAYPTDVKEVGEFRLHAGGELRSGVSVSHASDPAGTIGAIVRKGDRAFILSNSHVLALSGRARVGDPVLSPGTTDGGTLPSDRVATLAQFVAFDRIGDNAVDAAIAEIVPGRLADVRARIPHVQTPVHKTVAQRGMQVGKVGKATQETTAHVIDVDFHLSLTYPHGVGRLRFAHQILCTAFADHGDSGALVVDLDSGGVVGLHFAGTDSASACNPIGPVIDALGFNFAA